MDTDTLSQSVDKSQMPPLHQKRVLAFINHFIINSCTFLNDFASKCESKFIDIERKMQKVEAALTIIEAKLASVPDVAEPTTIDTATATTGIPQNDPYEKTENTNTASTDKPTEANEQEQVDDVATEQPSGVRACEDVRFKKFFKMVQFGVPAEAVKMKMQAEGFVPSILDTPNLLLEDGIAA